MAGKPLAVAATLAVLVLVLCGAALAENYHYARTAQDDALAASLLLKKSDYPAGLRLTGGRSKPDETPNKDTCDGRQPKVADLVVTGDAEAKFSNVRGGIIELDSEVETLQTAAMVKTDLRRNRQFLTQHCLTEVASQEHIELVRPGRITTTTRCGCDEIITTSFEIRTANPKLHLLWLESDVAMGRFEATVTTAVGKSTSDTQNLAANVAVTLHTRALQTLLARLAQRT